jgi:hypothetical protein
MKKSKSKQTLDLLMCQSLIIVYVSSRVFGLLNLLINSEMVEECRIVAVIILGFGASKNTSKGC